MKTPLFPNRTINLSPGIAGQLAGMNGRAITDNPHPEDSLAHTDWMLGWVVGFSSTLKEGALDVLNLEKLH